MFVKSQRKPLMVPSFGTELIYQPVDVTAVSADYTGAKKVDDISLRHADQSVLPQQIGQHELPTRRFLVCR